MHEFLAWTDQRDGQRDLSHAPRWGRAAFGFPDGLSALDEIPSKPATFGRQLRRAPVPGHQIRYDLVAEDTEYERL